MLPFTWRALLRDGAPWRSEWKHMLVLGALGMWICGAFVYQGGQSTSSINIALIYAATPIAIGRGQSRLLHERLQARRKLRASHWRWRACCSSLRRAT